MACWLLSAWYLSKVGLGFHPCSSCLLTVYWHHNIRKSSRLGNAFFSHIFNRFTSLNLNSFPQPCQSLCTNAECSTNTIAMVYVVSRSVKHSLHKKFVLLLYVLICGLSWLWIDRSAFTKGLARVNQSSVNIAQIQETRAARTNGTFFGSLSCYGHFHSRLYVLPQAISTP